MGQKSSIPPFAPKNKVARGFERDAPLKIDLNGIYFWKKTPPPLTPPPPKKKGSRTAPKMRCVRGYPGVETLILFYIRGLMIAYIIFGPFDLDM